MSIKEFVINWNGTWKHDYWWRKKYNVSFNSYEHRRVTPLDIKFEYTEYKMFEKASNDFDVLEKKKKALAEGRWIEEKESKVTIEQIWDKIDIDSFNGE